MSIISKGGNLTSSISDHFPQFSVFDISTHLKQKDRPKFGRSYKNFHHEEFQEELKRIDWNSSFRNKNVNDQVKILLDKVNDILNVMAPIRKLSKREIKLKQNPWITQGLLKSMRDRDKMYKQFTKETDPVKKHGFFTTYKQKRNLIITLLRQSKASYTLPLFLRKIKMTLKRLGKA